MEAIRFQTWFEHGCRNLLDELGTLTVDFAMKLWCKPVASSPIVIYFDVVGTMFTLMSGYSDSFAISLIRQLVAQQLDYFFVLPLYSRVPSASNLSDFPSRKIQHCFLLDTNCIPEGEVALVFNESLKHVESHNCMGGDRG